MELKFRESKINRKNQKQTERIRSIWNNPKESEKIRKKDRKEGNLDDSILYKNLREAEGT